MKGSNRRTRTVDRIAIAAIVAVAVLILGLFELTARSALQPMPTAVVLAMTSYVDLHGFKMNRRVPKAATNAGGH